MADEQVQLLTKLLAEVCMSHSGELSSNLVLQRLKRE